jgi:drug/metabolite transporter (DMT)-like permease
LLLVVLALIAEPRGERKASLKWFPFALLAMLGSGINAVFQKTHQYSAYAEELSYFLVYSLLFSAIFTGFAALVMREMPSGALRPVDKRDAKSVWVPLCLGACVGVMNFLNLYLAARLPSVVLFPVCNIGSMLLTGMVSALIWKDTPTKRQGIGFAIGIIAILMVGLL